MEDRAGAALYLEMTNLAPEPFAASRGREVLACRGAERATLWRNERPNREEYPRTVPEFETLLVCEVDRDFAPPDEPPGASGLLFHRTPRPGQGTMSGKPTLGLELIFVSPVDDDDAQALRDWADFLHIKEIAAAQVPGFTMITPYENARGKHPRFMHLYEMDTPEAEDAFQRMAPATIERIRPRGREAVREWMGHPALSIDYVNTFTRIGVLER